MSGLEVLGAIGTAIGVLSQAVVYGDQLLGAADEMTVARELLSTISSTMAEVSTKRYQLSQMIPPPQQKRIDQLLKKTDKFIGLVTKVVKTDEHMQSSRNRDRAVDAIKWVIRDNKKILSYQSVLMCLHGALLAAQQELAMLRTSSVGSTFHSNIYAHRPEYTYQGPPYQTPIYQGPNYQGSPYQGSPYQEPLYQDTVTRNFQVNNDPPPQFTPNNGPPPDFHVGNEPPSREPHGSIDERPLFCAPPKELELELDQDPPPAYEEIYSRESKKQVIEGLKRWTKEDETEATSMIHSREWAKGITDDFKRSRGMYSEKGFSAIVAETNRRKREGREAQRRMTMADAAFTRSYVSAMAQGARKKNRIRRGETM